MAVSQPSTYAKAIYGSVTAGLTAAGVAVTDGVITGPEWIVIALAVVGGFGVVYGVKNADEDDA